MKILTVVLSDQCNLNCSYCGVDKWSKRRINPELFLETYRALRSEFPEEKIRIDFFGGEPLLQLDLIKFIVDETSNDPNVAYEMPTNGLLLTQEIVDYLIENKIYINFSFDGLWQDTNRLQLNGKKTRDRLLEKKHLIDQLPKANVHTMIYKGCYNLLENHLWISENFGINPRLTLVRDVGVWDKKSIENLFKGITELFDWYIENPTREMPNFVLFYFQHFLNYHSRNVTTDFCGAGTDIFMFAENKKVPCTRFKDKPEMIELIPQYTKMSVCQTCEVKNYCKKGCLFEQIKNQGPIEELCSIYKYTYKEVKRMTASLRDNPYFKRVVLDQLEKDYEPNGYDT